MGRRVSATGWFRRRASCRIVSRSKENHTLEITLDYDKLVDTSRTEDVKVPAVPSGRDHRPDLVLLLSNAGLRWLVIVELKAPNTLLHSGHLEQRKNIFSARKKRLEDQGGQKADIKVEGYLIGSKAEPSERGEQVELLRARIKKKPENANWQPSTSATCWTARKSPTSICLTFITRPRASQTGCSDLTFHSAL